MTGMPRIPLRQRPVVSARPLKAMERHHPGMRPRVRPVLPSSGTVLSAGARTGQFTMFPAKMVLKRHEHAFEPGTRALPILRTVKPVKTLSSYPWFW